MKHLMPDVARKITEQQQADGLDFSALPSGSVLKARTQNSSYVIQLLGDLEAIVCGGTRFVSPTRVIFNGSTWGGSMLRAGWIGIGMNMEFIEKTENGLKTVLTSGVQAVQVIPEDGITFLLE